MSSAQTRAERMLRLINSDHETLLKPSAIGMAVRKEVLKRRGLITDASTRAPGATLDAGTKAALDQLIAWTATQEGLAWISA